VAVSRAFAPDDPARALVAQVAANEVAGRLGLALFLGPHNGQFWASIHCAVGAVAAGVGLGLDAQRLAHALAIALYQPPYGLWPGFMGPATKLLTAAEPAVQGACAALLAAKSVQGSLEIIEDDRGLLTHLSFVGRPSAFGGLGEVWLSDTLAFKPYPGCAYLQAAVDAALSAEVSPAEVREVEITGGYLTAAMEALGQRAGLRPVGVTFSAKLSVAVAIVAGRLTHNELSREWLADNESAIRELAVRMTVRHDWELTLATLQGAARGGATLREVPLRAWGRVGRRMRELHMTDSSLGMRDMGALARDPRLLRRLRRAALGPGGGGTETLDTRALRMTFPCRLTLRRSRADGTSNQLRAAGGLTVWSGPRSQQDAASVCAQLPRRSSTVHGTSRSRISGSPVRSVTLRAQAVAIAKQSPSAIGVLAFRRAVSIISAVPGRSSSNALRNPLSTSSASERPWSRSTR
jgi:hypothetical protein